jgi:hypothetical protein
MKKIKCYIILLLLPTLANACPHSYSKFISNIDGYIKDGSSATYKISKEFNDCYLDKNKNIEKSTYWQVEYLRNVAYMTGDKRVLDETKEILKMPIQKKDSHKIYKKILEIAILLRDSDFANDIKKNHNLRNDIPPKLHEVKKRNLLVNNVGTRQWVGFEFPKGGHIIVVANDFCSFSKKFLNFVHSDVLLESSMKKNSTWISPVDFDLEEGSLIKDIYNVSDWPEIESWETPSIYFYYDGKLVSKIIGWPGEGEVNDFIADSNKIGFKFIK